jgi:hypothetical protein
METKGLPRTPTAWEELMMALAPHTQHSILKKVTKISNLKAGQEWSLNPRAFITGTHERWREEEDDRLIEIMINTGFLHTQDGWEIVAIEFPGRTWRAVKQRARQLHYAGRWVDGDAGEQPGLGDQPPPQTPPEAPMELLDGSRVTGLSPEGVEAPPPTLPPPAESQELEFSFLPDSVEPRLPGLWGSEETSQGVGNTPPQGWGFVKMADGEVPFEHGQQAFSDLGSFPRPPR